MRRDKAGISPILILGGTSEATALVSALAPEPRFACTLSLAGRTSVPKKAPVPTRIGGFGGVEGLASWIAENGVERVVDATHPFAARISRNAAEACARTRTPLLAIRRPAWGALPGDLWIEVDDMAAAAASLGAAPRRVFLTIGRQELAAFAGAPQHAYHVRTIEPVGAALPVPHLTHITARGPFSQEAEVALMREAGIELVVTKNSGGDATYGKIAAARELGLPVVMVRRPDVPEVPSISDANGALAWLSGDNQPERSTLRGV